ncbi:MAG: AsmA family protein [Alistipes onderdonkii]
MKKWIKITSIVTAVIAVIVLAVAVSIAPLAKNYIEKHDRELLGRSIRMERLKFNIFTGRLRIGDLRIGGADDSTTFFRLDSFDMRMRLWPLLSNRVVVKKLSFAAPGIKVYQRGNSFSFDDILAHFAGDTILAAATPEKPSKPWEIGIYDISIRNGQVFYKDLLLDATWGMKDINLHIPGVYFSGKRRPTWAPS